MASVPFTATAFASRHPTGTADPIEEITEDEYRYIAASGDWAQPQPPSRNDATMYNDWD